MIDKLSKSVGEALSGIVKALIDLPAFQADCYCRLLEATLAHLPADTPVAEALARLDALIPDYPLLGEVRARIEGMLYTETGSEGGISFAVPLGNLSLGGKYSRSSTESSAGSLVVEISASYGQTTPPFPRGELEKLTIGELLEKVGKLKGQTPSE